MPGFAVQGVGDGARSVRASGTTEFYYKYTWEIENIFGFRGQQLIMLRDATLPTFSVGKEIVQGSSVEYKFAKNVTWDDCRFTWYDTRGMIDIVRGWRESVWRPDTGIQTPATYKLDSYIQNYLPDGDGLVRWRLVNSWPSIIRHGDLTYSDSNVKLVEVTVTYDWAYENTGPGDSVGISGPVPSSSFNNFTGSSQTGGAPSDSSSNIPINPIGNTGSGLQTIL